MVHRSQQHTSLGSTPVSAAHRSGQHTGLGSTPVSAAHRSRRHRSQWYTGLSSTPVSAAHQSRQHTGLSSTPVAAAHRSRRTAGPSPGRLTGNSPERPHLAGGAFDSSLGLSARAEEAKWLIYSAETIETVGISHQRRQALRRCTRSCEMRRRVCDAVQSGCRGTTSDAFSAQQAL